MVFAADATREFSRSITRPDRRPRGDADHGRRRAFRLQRLRHRDRAYDAEDGHELWRHLLDGEGKRQGKPCRGVSYLKVPGATGACAERIFASQAPDLVALDARTGRPCDDFGQGGRVLLMDGISPVSFGIYYVSSAPQVVRGKVVVGGGIIDGQRWGDPSGARDTTAPSRRRRSTLPSSPIPATAAVLAEVAAILALPTFFSTVRVDGIEPEMISELRAYAKEPNTFLRKSVSPFLDSPTVEALAATGRRTLVVAGFATEAVVVRVVLGALAAGYSVHLPVDAVGGPSTRTEAGVMRRMERADCVPTCVFTLASMLAPDFSTPPGSRTFGALQVLR